MNKEHMVSMLVEFSVAAAAEDRQGTWLREIFTKGFRGFAGMASAELLRELRYRGLEGFDDADAEEDFDDDADTSGIDTLIGLDRSHSLEDAERG